MKILTAIGLLILTATLTACGSGAPTTAAAVQPTATLTVDSTTVNSGGAAMLSWSSSNATACHAIDGWSGDLATSGTQSSGPLTTSTTFSLTCTSGNASSAESSVAVTVTPVGTPAPTVTLAAAPPSVDSGATSTLTWSSTNAAACTASGGWAGNQATSGTFTTPALTASTTYSLVCSGDGGTSDTENTTVTVTGAATPPAPTVTLTAAPTSITSGQTSTLSWASTNATACTASGGWTGSKAPSGTLTTPALTTATTYVMVCSGAGGTSAAVHAVVTVSGATTPVPTATLTASPTSIASGHTSTLTWSSANATACTASGGWTGSKAASGTLTTAALAATTTFTLTCTGTGGTSPAANAVVTVTPAPTTTLSAAPTSVASGHTSTLTWSSTNATACTASGGWTGTKATSGTFTTPALTASTTYSLTCSGTGGASPAATATVSVTAAAPTATLSAAPTSVASGHTSTLTWSSTNATACTASGGWTGTKATSGTFTTPALTASTTYSLTCSGTGGAAPAATATVSVTAAAPTATLSAAPTSVANGSTSTLTWSSTNATACTASGGWTGTKATSGTFTTPALTVTTTYSLTCSGTGGTSPAATATVSVTAAAAPTVTLSAAPSSVASGGSSTLTWSSSNATACTASGNWTGTKALSGTQSSGALAATATYTLTCTGTGGSAHASATVSIASGSMSPGTVALVSGQTQTFTQTTGGTVTFSVDGLTNGNAAVGTISSAGLYTAGTDTGAHTILATSAGNGAVSQSARAIVTDLTAVSSYHGGNGRDGANTQEYALSPTSVAAATFGKLASCTVDGAVSAQPLWVANLTIGGAKHNVVFVATLHDSLYAIDADSASCTQLWKDSLLGAGETSVPWSTLGKGTGDIQPEVGIVGTPVIDTANNILFVVSKSINAAHTVFYNRIHAIDLTTGAEKAGSPVEITGTVSGSGSGGSTVTFDPKQHMARTGLALSNGNVYVSMSSHEDSDPYFAWVFAYQYSGSALTQTHILNLSPDASRSGIWMSAGAPAVDSANNLFLLTGNGAFNASNGAAPNRDYGDSLVELSTSLAVSQYWTPTDQQRDANNDFDFGSGGAAVLADLPMGAAYLHVLVCGGKAGVLEVLNRDMLGGYTGATVQEIDMNGHGLFGTVAFWNNRLYVAGANSALLAYTLNTSTAQFSLGSSSAKVYNWPGVTPAISASGTSNGVAWAMDTHNYCTAQASACSATVLHAYNATNLGTELWNSGTNAADAAGYPVKFTTLTVANGHVYFGTRGNNTGGATSSVPGTLEIYGLKP